MWYEVKNAKDAMEFLNRMGFFHDSCIKEMKYYSGAFVNEDLSMHPTNDCRTLSVIIQRQFPENPPFSAVPASYGINTNLLSTFRFSPAHTFFHFKFLSTSAYNDNVQ